MRGVNINAQEVVDALAQFDPYGTWRIDISSGLMHWSEDVFRIHGLQQTDGPVNLITVLNVYHPADREIVLRAIEETTARKSGFRYVLRVQRRTGGYKLVKCTGTYRELEDATPEIVGTFSQFQSAQRALAIYG